VVSAPVEPADVNAAPLAARRPELSGRPRVTETITSTAGMWRGATPMTTSIRWQRCDDTPQSCVDIPGATGESYQVVLADEGKRLRTVVEAQGAAGSGTSASIISPLMRPAMYTAFLIDGTMPLATVADAIRDVGGTAWISVDYDDGDNRGSYGTGSGASVDAVLAKFASPSYPGVNVPVTRFTLAGEVATGALGGVADRIAARLEVPSIQVKQDPEAPQVRSAARAMYVEPTLRDGFVRWSRLNAWGHPCEGGDCDDVDAEADWEAVHMRAPAHPDFPRIIESSFTWRPSGGELIARMTAEGRRYAWENDVKLYNGENFDPDPWGIICPSWDKNDFWIDDRDDVLIETDIPAEAGVYWDTDASGSCDEKDLTYGVYHPERLLPGGDYHTTIYLDSAGDEESSRFRWRSQPLERRPPDPLGSECDWSPWCVNVPPYAGYVSGGSEFVKAEYDLRLPDCWEYNEDWSQYHAESCRFPVLAPAGEKRG
jgi:hypothetical protein